VGRKLKGKTGEFMDIYIQDVEIEMERNGVYCIIWTQ